MKYLIIWIATLGLAACVTASTPARVGMSVADYRATCTVGAPSINSIGDFRVGECADKPGEFALFQAGYVSKVLDTDGFYSEISAAACNTEDAACRDEVKQLIAERVAAKAEFGTQTRRQAEAEAMSRFGAALSSAGNNMSAASAASSGSTAPHVTSGYCPKSGEASSSFNKICYYNCLGSTVARNVGAVELCPLSINN